ncbi:MAG: acyl-CoA thioesterase [Chitinophagaceae bacterium]
MENFKLDIQIRWSDLDPNFHLRHSVYYDWGALCRVHFLNLYGLNAAVMQELKIGPILFREEAIFRKEIRSEDVVFITLELKKARKDFSRWAIQHQIIKSGDLLAAVVTVEGAWIDIVKRKLTLPPDKVAHIFDTMPKGENFEWM